LKLELFQQQKLLLLSVTESLQLTQYGNLQ